MASPKLSVAQSASPCKCALLDIETRNPDAEEMAELEQRFNAEWEPPANYKDAAKIEARRAEDLVKFRDKAALLPQAPIAVVGVMLDDGRTYQLHAMGAEKPRWRDARRRKVSVEGFAGERELMRALAALLAEETDAETMLVGFNVLAFDLPKARLACVRHGLELPEALRLKLVEDDERQPVFDLMVQYCRKFLGTRELFISQEEMLFQMGIRPAIGRDVASGAEVPKLLEAGKLDAVLTKNLADLADLRQAFLRMTGHWYR